MKQLIALGICLFIFGAASAQKKKEPMPNISVIPQKPGVFHKSAIGGYFTDMNKHPIKGVQAFIYLPDSTIGASGFTDEAGYYETNAIPPGSYDVKFIYPVSSAFMKISGVPIVKEMITEISFFKGTAPSTDTTFSYMVIEPKPVIIEKAKKKKK